MNFTKLISQLDKVKQKNHQVDQKFMTVETYNKKYPNYSNKNHQLSCNPSEKLQKSNLKQLKHRYFQDIKQDEIQDQNIFGFSFYQFLFSQKRKQIEINKNNNLFISTKNNNKNKFEAKNYQTTLKEDQIKQKILRPKTAIIERGIPSKRRLHHKLSLNQIQKAVTQQSLTPHSQSKQQFFTQTFFNFKSEEKENMKKSNFCTENYRSSSKIESPKGFSFINKTSYSNFKKYQSDSIQNDNKNYSSVNNTFKKFNEKNKSIPILKKKKKYSLDFEKIAQQKAKFNQNIQNIFNNLSKKSPETIENENLLLSKSIVYEKKYSQNQLQNQNQKVKQHQFAHQNFKENEIMAESYFLENNQQQETDSLKLQKSIQKRVNFQTQLTQKSPFQIQEILKKHKISFDLSIIHQSNELFLQCHQLQQLQFKQDSFLGTNSIEKKIIEEIINRSNQNKEFTNKSLKDFSSKSFKKIQKNNSLIYKLYLFNGLTLECLKLQNIKFTEKGFYYEKKLTSILSLCQKFMSKKTSFDFVHVLITSQLENKKNQKIDSQQSQKNLVFETFIHNSDIKYFQGREVQIQYFKYFLKRFITFDPSIKSRKQIEDSLSLILQSEVNTPLEFEQFCYVIDLKGDMNIFTVKSQLQNSSEPNFKCFNINLSTLLVNANKSIQMIKKQLFEGYNWKGVSLKKQLQKNKGNQLEHFYI